MTDPDWKQYAEAWLEHDPTVFDGALLETDCPECGRHVGALVKDGPDPVFADLACPLCAHEWTERVT